MIENKSLRAGRKKENRLPAYRAIAGDLRGRIQNRRFKTGEFLPAEEVLAEQYSVSRMTLRAALKELKTEGLIRPRRPLGWEVLNESRGIVRLFCPVPGGVGAADYEVVKAAALECQRRGLSFRPLFMENWPDMLTPLLHPLQQAGVLFLSGLPVSEGMIRSATVHGLPVAAVGTEAAGTDSIWPDGRRAAELIINHLAETGHRRILYFGWDSAEDPSFNQMTDGVETACRRRRIPAEIRRLPLNRFSPDDEKRFLDTLAGMPTRPDAVLFGSQPLCLQAHGTIARAGLSVPDDFSLALIGDVPPAEEKAVIGRSITHVHYDWEAAVCWAMERLIRRAREPELPPIRGEFSLALVHGETTPVRCAG